ncbi:MULTISPECIES: N-acetylglucosamine-6-phosphate deacetylase [unclassified Spirosoma]|uniref:N-acetylglucosamine-6-phosphate deacetylase n=1 Tax=unclassified Spirosoma TaxID=2621999 RepID=UPI000964C7EF|nr:MULTISPECIES: N-acetylglucosamine-6-phosphate deacetylase [unclassified Spirosoma]MBN8823633.1 N-acetylglucosamine-6-phosphate deacetylase [Spirosoma sp.]OJW76809.1 MAG: N-acetylglucosamine-6-phosphate deacetylase [Spirosoma sp. 48-14]
MNQFVNATVFTGDEWLTNATVRVENGRIQEITTADNISTDITSSIDLAGDYLIPGLIDLQLYGGSNLFLNEVPTPDTVRHIYNSHAQNGTTTLLPTIHSTSLAVMQQAMAAVAVARDEDPFGVPGLHIEGPYFNPVKRGAHSMAYVRTPAEGELEALFSTNADIIRILTLAPEIFSPEQFETIKQLKHPNTLLSLGHSNATYEQATAAFDNGVPLSTHLYNAMRGFESREPGVVGAVFDHPTVRASIIADSYHCNPTTIRIAYRLLGERLFLISDALFANPPRPSFTLGQFVVHYEPDSNGPGRYVNDEGNLAGSAITLIDCVRIAVEQAEIPLTNALRMASTVPADIIGMGHQLGKIQPGYVANLVRTDQSLHTKGVWTQGVAIR